MLPSVLYSKTSHTYLHTHQTISWKLLTFIKLPHCTIFNYKISQLVCRNNSIAPKCLVLSLKLDGDRYNLENVYLYHLSFLGQFLLIDVTKHVLFQVSCQFLKTNYYLLLLGTKMKSLGVHYLLQAL